MKNEFNIPCETCILLPECLPKYKNLIKQNYKWPVYRMCIECNILEPYYKSYKKLNADEKPNPMDEWWEKTYGRKIRDSM